LLRFDTPHIDPDTARALHPQPDHTNGSAASFTASFYRKNPTHTPEAPSGYIPTEVPCTAVPLAAFHWASGVICASKNVAKPRNVLGTDIGNHIAGRIAEIAAVICIAL